MKPEIAVRKLVHKLGYRFRLHKRDLAGTPDLVFRSRRKVIFVHGCFWHSHGCKTAHVPKSNQEYWGPKLRRNRLRDRQNQKTLSAQGWQSMIVWECETRDEVKLVRRLNKFLGVNQKKRNEEVLLSNE